MSPVRDKKPPVSANLATPNWVSSGMRLRVFLYAFAGFVWVTLPAIAYAQGLVPCQGAADCNICTFGELIQKIINFAIGLSIPLAALLFAYAGWLYLSNREDPGRIEKARKIFTTVFIGFAIAIAGWLVVQTILKTLAPGYESWTEFRCTAERPMNATIGQVLNKAGVGQVPYTPVQVTGRNDLVFFGGGSTFGNVCADGNSPSITETGNYCFGSDGTATAAYYAAGGNSGQGTQQWLSQLEQACADSGLYDCRLAQAIMANESSGKANAVSSVGAGGLMQIMPGTARGLDPSLRGFSDHEVRQRLINDPAYNMQLGTRYIAQLSNQFNGDPALVAAAYNGGPKANQTSVNCGGGTAWQCQINSGYRETRNYVPKVLDTYSKLR